MFLSFNELEVNDMLRLYSHINPEQQKISWAQFSVLCTGNCYFSIAACGMHIISKLFPQ